MTNCMVRLLTVIAGLLVSPLAAERAHAVNDQSPLGEKAEYFQRDLLEKHWLDGLYVSIVPSVASGTRLSHSVDEPGNVIHAGVWTGRYLAGVAYQYAVTRDPQVRARGGQILKALRILQEVTGKPGLLARGYVKGHGPVAGYERDGGDSKKWRQGQGPYADYRFHGDVSVDNFNAVLYGYAIYFDLAADDKQKDFIRHDVDRLMTHLLDNHCRIIDLNGEPTQFGHVGIDPDPARVDYYNKLYRRRLRFAGTTSVNAFPLRSQLMLLPDLLIADHITGKPRYQDVYRQVIARFKNNPEPEFYRRARSPERIAKTNHSSEGQAYEALFNLIRYEHDPALLKTYDDWLRDLWEANWNEGNSLFAYMTLALLPVDRSNLLGAAAANRNAGVPHASEGLKLANASLTLYPIDRVFRPVMNSIRKDIELNKVRDRSNRRQAARPLPINERPLDNEYCWKGSPYELDGWLKPTVTSLQFACDDPLVAWFADSSGRVYRTLNRGRSWENMSNGLMGAVVQSLVASKDRTFVLWAKSSDSVYVTRDGGLSWRKTDQATAEFPKLKFDEWLAVNKALSVRITPQGQLVRSLDGGKTSELAMRGWRIPIAASLFKTPWGLVASGPGGAYQSSDCTSWTELKLWPEEETGAADYLHAYWMGRFFGFVPPDV